MSQSRTTTGPRHRAPFGVIARKNEFNAENLAFSILDPHPRMNVTLTREDAEDIAAYIVTFNRP
jgi:hypothetical protein